MAVGNFAQSELNSAVAVKVKGTYTAANFLTIANEAARVVVADIDLRGCIRRAALSPNLFDEIYQYTWPSDAKGDKVIDIAPQVRRTRYGDWTLVTPEEFDRLKSNLAVDSYGDPLEVSKGVAWTGDNIVAIQRDDLVNKLMLSKPIDDEEQVIDRFDAVGDWEGFGDGENLTADNDDYVKDAGSVNWDINADGGTTAGIVNSSLDTFDVSDYKSTGSVFVWVYVTSATNLTNFILRIGSSATAYYSITITTNNEGASFYAGWNLLRFDFVDKSTTGTPDDDGCDYAALYMTKDAAKVSETDYRFDNLVMKRGKHYDVVYYTRYPWQSSAGTFLEDATATTDLLNCEADEYPLFIEKTAELIEESVGHFKLADRHAKKYEAMKAKYLLENPSQALLLTSTYHHF